MGLSSLIPRRFTLSPTFALHQYQMAHRAATLELVADLVKTKMRIACMQCSVHAPPRDPYLGSPARNFRF
jgi:hypothetical protein